MIFHNINLIVSHMLRTEKFIQFSIIRAKILSQRSPSILEEILVFTNPKTDSACGKLIFFFLLLKIEKANEKQRQS